jgi:diguanylate cyclase (GGDEF)-like protein
MNTSTPASSEPARAQRILMIDDTPANLAVVADQLRQAGYRIAVAQDGEEGISRAERIEPDLILLDVMMPGIDGFETCRRLKAADKTRAIPVIFMTALGEIQDKVAGFAAGGVDYLTKPLQIEDLMARIGTHLALSAAHKLVMLQNLKLLQAEQALQAINKTLEERVQARTAELQQINKSLDAEIVGHQIAERRIRHMAHHDALTGLPNRLLLVDRLKQAVAQARRQNERVGLLFIDLDYFKGVNDSLGHQIGDGLLQQVASRLLQCVREADSVARLGGDEFVICLPALTDSNEAALVAGKALAALNTPFSVDNHDLHISGSIGISLFPEDGGGDGDGDGDGDDVTSLMRAADAAMYHAKQNGRNSYQFFTADLNQAALRRVTVADQLHHALDSDGFELHFQPQVHIESGHIFAAEALLRLILPGEEPVSCGDFIAIAEETGLILPIGEWVLRQACSQLKVWRDAGHSRMRMAVNLSERQFHQPGLVELITRVLANSGLPADGLELEITESILMQSGNYNIEVLKALWTMGVQVSIDNFGTGYTSLAYLQQVPIHALKIDRSFIHGISQADPHSKGAAIVTTIIGMAHSLNLNIIAEGVNSTEQASFLKKHDCPDAQGFLYGKAVSAQEFSRLLAAQAS